VLCIYAIAMLLPLVARDQGTRPYFASGNTSSMPPDTKAPAHTQLSTKQVQQQIQNKLDDEPVLKGSLIATVDDTKVVLRGEVAEQQQRDVAIRIARSYAGDRKVVDKYPDEEVYPQLAVEALGS
jgi:osmotically-inducible protein OsmY